MLMMAARVDADPDADRADMGADAGACGVGRTRAKQHQREDRSN
jgi:hypothetical protein